MSDILTVSCIVITGFTLALVTESLLFALIISAWT